VVIATSLLSLATARAQPNPEIPACVPVPDAQPVADFAACMKPAPTDGTPPTYRQGVFVHRIVLEQP
jgi:hypothetical protein